MTVTKKKIGKQDHELFDGRNRTFNRLDSTGGESSITKIGETVDVLHVFGGGTSQTAGTINQALNRIGSSNRCILELQTGAWTIDADVTITSNFEIKIPYGCYLNISSGITFTISGSIDCGAYNIYQGSGTLTISGTVIPQWWGVLGDGSTDDSTAIGRMTTGSGAGDRSIIWPKATYKISTTTTIASNFTNIVQAGAVFSVDSAITLTFSGPVFRHASTWTSGSGTVSTAKTEAALIGSADAGGYYTATDVEGVLQEIGQIFSNSQNFIPISLFNLRLSTSFDVAAIGDLNYKSEGLSSYQATNHGLITIDSTPYLEAINSLSDGCQRITWLSGQTEAILFQTPLPPNFDTANNLVLHMRIASGGTTDAVGFTVDSFFNEGDTLVSDTSGTNQTTTYTEVTTTIAAADIPSGAQTLTCQLTPVSHPTDDLHLTSIWLEYTGTLLSS